MLQADIDAASTAFDVVSFEERQQGLRLLPQESPSLMKAESRAQNWLRSSEPKQPPNQFLYLDSLGYVCCASGDKATVWRESSHEPAAEYTFGDDITCIGMMHHNRVEHILVIFAGQRLHLVSVQQAAHGMVHFLPIRVSGGDLPTEINCIRATKMGKALIGGIDGVVYQLKLDLSGTYVTEGFNATVLNLTWEWKRVLAPRIPIREIHVDQERQLAYAVNDTCEIEVLSFEDGLLSEKPTRVAIYDCGGDIHITSFAILPKSGFGGAVFLAVSQSGDMFFFTLDQSRLTLKEFSAEAVKKKAKFLCGIGLKKNLRLTHVIPDAVPHFASCMAEGGSVKVVAVFETSIYLSAYQHKDGTSTLWELKNGIDGIRDLQMVNGTTIHGRVLGLLPREPLPQQFGGVRSIEDRGRINELTMQFFYPMQKMVLFTNEQFQRLHRRWPCDVLSSILERGDEDELKAFIETYSMPETAAMLLFLCLREDKAAKELLLDDPRFAASVPEGCIKFFKRLTIPIWLAEVFACENKGSFILPRHVMRVKIPATTLRSFKDAGERLLKLLRVFLGKAQIDVYESGEIFVRATSTVTEEQAKGVVQFRYFLECFTSSMAAFEYLSTVKDICIPKGRKKDLAREVSQMSVHDFVFFVINRRTDLYEFFRDVGTEMDFVEKKKLYHFFHKTTPLLDPFPKPRKEDALGQSLTERLRVLRRDIRSLNEQLGKFTEQEIPDKDKRDVELRSHYYRLFFTIQLLSEELHRAQDRDAVIDEALKFVKVAMEVAHPGMRQAILMQFAVSPLGDKTIICREKAFEKVLKTAAGLKGRYRNFADFNKDQIEAINLLIGFYEKNYRFMDAGRLSVVLATRKPDPKLESPSLEVRFAYLKRAQNYFRKANASVNVSAVVHHLKVQKEAARIVSSLYGNSERDAEDEQVLSLLKTSIVPSSTLRAMIKCWLSDDDEETRAAFQASNEYKTVEALLEALV